MKFRNLVLALLCTFTLLSLSACKFGGDPKPDDTSANITTQEVAYYTNAENKVVNGYLAMPNDGKKHPALILIHEWWGLNDYMRENAEKFAEQGYVALAVDLYGGVSTENAEEAMQLASGVRENTEEAFRNLKSAVSYLQAQPGVEAESLASVGWCFGGGWAYEMARNNLGLKSSVMYYGEMHPEDDLQNMKALILGNFGEKDTSISVDTVKEFQAKLKTLSGEHEVYIYPNAGHGFDNPDNPNYDPAAAELAWERTLRFLQKTVGGNTNVETPETSNISKGTFTVDEVGNWYGEVLVRGYPEVRKVPEPFCTENCKEYDYVFFHMLQTTSPEFKKFLDENKGNSFVVSPDDGSLQASNYQVGLGCKEGDIISYENDSDEKGMQQLSVPAELTAEIFAATREKPIALKLNKLKLSAGRGAPACYAHFTTVEKVG